jgi:hypothetical protein
MYLVMGLPSTIPRTRSRSQKNDDYFDFDGCDAVDHFYYDYKSDKENTSMKMLGDAISGVLTVDTVISSESFLSEDESDHNQSVENHSSYQCTRPSWHVGITQETIEVLAVWDNEISPTSSSRSDEAALDHNESLPLNDKEGPIEESASVEVTAAWDSHSTLVTYIKTKPQYDLRPTYKKSRRRQRQRLGRLVCTPESPQRTYRQSIASKASFLKRCSTNSQSPLEFSFPNRKVRVADI